MVHESNIGVLAYRSASPICDASYSVAIKETGVGPPRPRRAWRTSWWTRCSRSRCRGAALKSGTGGTATTFKSKFKKNAVETVSLAFAPSAACDNS